MHVFVGVHVCVSLSAFLKRLPCSLPLLFGMEEITKTRKSFASLSLWWIKPSHWHSCESLGNLHFKVHKSHPGLSREGRTDNCQTSHSPTPWSVWIRVQRTGVLHSELAQGDWLVCEKGPHGRQKLLECVTWWCASCKWIWNIWIKFHPKQTGLWKLVGEKYLLANKPKTLFGYFWTQRSAPVVRMRAQVSLLCWFSPPKSTANADGAKGTDAMSHHLSIAKSGDIIHLTAIYWATTKISYCAMTPEILQKTRQTQICSLGVCSSEKT